MMPLSKRPKNFFAYIQVETNEIILNVFRFEERVYDAVLVRAKTVSGDFTDSAAVAPALSGLIDEVKKTENGRIIIGFHSALFSTVQTVVTSRRDDPRKIVDEAELENVVSSGLWKVFSRAQKELARKMNIFESATVLMGALVTKVRVDGHRVVTPVGFPAHTIELTILYSAASRSLAEILAPFLAGEEELYLTEIGMSETLRLAEQKEAEDFLLVRVSEAHTYVYRSSGDERIYEDTIMWGRRTLVGALVNELMISRTQAVELLARADAGLTSAHVRRRIEGLLLQEIAVLLKGIGSHATTGACKTVYIEAPFSLPEALFAQAAAKRFGIDVPIIPMHSDSRGGKVKSALPLSMKPTAASIPALCANAWAASRSFEQSDLAKIAKRRARWLTNSLAK